MTLNQEILAEGGFLYGEETAVHELGHAWSYIHEKRRGQSLASEMFHFTHYRDETDEWVDRETAVSVYGGHSGDGGRTYSQEEDWAETVAALAFHDVDPGTYLYWTAAQERRYFIQQHLDGH